MHSGSGSTPVPDPTLLTTEALKREISALKELVTTRLDAMDKAMSIFSENLQRTPTDTDKQIGHLKELIFGRLDTVDVKFDGVQTQIIERDASVEKTARDTKTAVDAALAAAKELSNKQADSFALSIGKSETTTTKQIDQLGVIIQQNTKASDEKIGDIKDRLTRIEGTGKGRGDMLGWVVAGISTLAAIVSIVFALTRS
jgi:hypothetical protein